MCFSHFQLATERYASLGVDTTQVLEKMNKISLSLHCWQADDVTGFENQGRFAYPEVYRLPETIRVRLVR